jgi:hypothetical protein
MNKFILVILSLLLCACEITITDEDGSIIINIKDSGVDSSVHDHDAGEAGMDSSVEIDAGHPHDASMGAVVITDSSHEHDTGIDSAVVVDSGHSHQDAMTMGINVDKIPQGDPGYSTERIRSTSEQPVPNQDVGAFRSECAYSHMNFDDPIVYPGRPNAAHLHTYFGHAGVDAFSTADNLKNTGNSTCLGGILNRSAYWIPSLIAANGDPLVPNYVQWYYKSGYSGVHPEDITTPIPSGLKIIAGYKDDVRETNSQWNCLDNYRSPTQTIQQCPSGDKILLVTTFPQCWDGINLDSPDHRSHMAYANDGCPSTHPIALVQLTMNLGWDVSNISGVRLSSDIMLGTAPGASAHADYIALWDEDLIKSWTDACVTVSADCHSHLVGNGQMIY